MYLCILHPMHLAVEHTEGSEYKALHLLFPQQVNGVLSNVDYTTTGPVLVAHLLQWERCTETHITAGHHCQCTPPHLPCLHQVREHDHHSTLPVVDHLPEVSGSGLHGTLGYDEGSLLLVALECVEEVTSSNHIHITYRAYTYIHNHGMDVVLHLSLEHHTPAVSWSSRTQSTA